MNFPISVTSEYTKQNLLEMHKSVHRRARKKYRLMSLVGAVMFVVGYLFLGVIMGVGALMFAGGIWFVLCQIFANQAARKTTRKTIKSNLKYYGGTVQTTVKFYTTMFMAKNDTTGAEVRAQYEEVTRLLRTKNLAVLVLADGRAMMADLRTMEPLDAEELWAHLREKCTEATVLE